jgi:hypothetical protein
MRRQLFANSSPLTLSPLSTCFSISAIALSIFVRLLDIESLPDNEAAACHDSVPLRRGYSMARPGAEETGGEQRMCDEV